MRLPTSPKSALALALALSAATAKGEDLFSDDFESYAAGTNLNTSGPWGTASGGSILGIRDEATATPFGSPNRYLAYADASTTVAGRAQSPNISAASGAITTLSFDFNEPSGAASNDLLFGYTEAGADLNTAGSYLRLGIRDGSITSKEPGGWTDAGATGYALDTSYTIYVVLNDSTDTIVDYFEGRTLAAGTADVWLDIWGNGTPVFVGTTVPGGTQTASYRVGLRTFTTNLQAVLVDNYLLETGIGGPMETVLPPTIPASAQPKSQTVPAGTGLIYLTVNPSGSDPFSYQWKLGGADIPGATERTLSIDMPSAADAGDYTVEVTGVAGSTTSAPATVTLGSSTPSPIDDFNSYVPGFLETVSDSWTVNLNGHYSVTDSGNGDNFLGALDDDGAGTAPTLKELGPGQAIPDGSTSTFFTRLYRDSSADGGLWYGLTDSLTGGFNAFEGYITASATGNIGVRDGGAGAGTIANIASDTWYNFWMIHNNETESVQVFMTTGDRDATLTDRLANTAGKFEFQFRNGTSNNLSHVQLINRTTAGPWRVDDLYISPLANLANPIGTAAFAITNISYSPGDEMVTLTWLSRPADTYTVRYSPDLINWEGDLNDTVFADPGTSTTKTYDVSGLASPDGKLFFRVERN